MKDKAKIVYEQPSVEIICVEAEGGIFSISPGGGDINNPGNGREYDFDLY